MMKMFAMRVSSQALCEVFPLGRTLAKFVDCLCTQAGPGAYPMAPGVAPLACPRCARAAGSQSGA